MADENDSENVEECHTLRIEADEVVKEVAFAVKSVEISSKIPLLENEVYLNLCTLEEQKFCVQLSVQGFRVVGSTYDTIEMDVHENSRHYETIYALLDSVSPSYRRTFGDALMKKLAMLGGGGGSEEDEAMSQD